MARNVVFDKSEANLTGLQNIKWLLLLHGWFWLIEILQIKYLNNTIEQDHLFLKKLTRPAKGLKSFRYASAALDAYRSGSHDPQAAIFSRLPIGIPAIRCTRDIAMSSDSRSLGISKKLRQSPLASERDGRHSFRHGNFSFRKTTDIGKAVKRAID